MKPYIKEVIIVEGRDDTNRLKEVFDCETIETKGSAINTTILNEINVALSQRGAIIFTDPDYPGTKIRNIILEHFPEIKEAFLPQYKARSKEGKVGVEHAAPDSLKEALNKAVTRKVNLTKIYNHSDMIDYKLSGQPDSKKRRLFLSERLNIGYANAMSMLNKLNRYNIKREKVEKILKEYEGRIL